MAQPKVNSLAQRKAAFLIKAVVSLAVRHKNSPAQRKAAFLIKVAASLAAQSRMMYPVQRKASLRN